MVLLIIQHPDVPQTYKTWQDEVLGFNLFPMCRGIQVNGQLFTLFGNITDINNLIYISSNSYMSVINGILYNNSGKDVCIINSCSQRFPFPFVCNYICNTEHLNIICQNDFLFGEENTYQKQGNNNLIKNQRSLWSAYLTT